MDSYSSSIFQDIYKLVHIESVAVEQGFFISIIDDTQLCFVWSMALYHAGMSEYMQQYYQYLLTTSNVQFRPCMISYLKRKTYF